MDWQLLAPFLTATLLLLVTPGPVVAIVANNAFRGGAAAGIMAALGVEIGEVFVLSAVFSGLVLSQEFLPLLFRWISLSGIAYLVWLAVKLVRNPRAGGNDSVTRSARPALDGVAIAFCNPATFIFYTAFFPQFVTPQHALLPQLIGLGSIYLVASFVFDIILVIAVVWLRSSAGRDYFRFARFAELASAALYFCVAVFSLIGLANVSA